MKGWSAASRGAPDITISGAEGPDDNQCIREWAGYRCTRELLHAGRHLASTGGDRITAAWPGEHAPTVADLTAGGS